MDNHPIPQDVTSFQFRLIGNMTVKQFAYLAAGCALALIIYYLPLFIIFKILLIALTAGLGFALAFVPVEGRPLDAMLGFYLRALTSPNQYVFHKTMGHFSFDRSFQQTPAIPMHVPVAVQKPVRQKVSLSDKRKKLTTLLQQSSTQPISKTDSHEQAFLSSVLTNAAPQPASPTIILPTPTLDLSPEPQKPETSEPQQDDTSAVGTVQIENTSGATILPPPPPPPSIAVPIPSATLIPSAEELIEQKRASQEEEQQLIQKEKELRKEEERIQAEKLAEEKEHEAKMQEIAQAEEKAKKISEDNQMTHEKLLELEKNMQEMLSQKQSLELELQKLKAQLQTKEAPKTYTPSTAPEEPKQQTQLVRQIPQGQTQKRGLPPTPDSPNILLGLVKDSSGNILPNILIEVKDAEGNPVRAFKTNQLGQFASATPLSNGTYTIEFEDPNGKNKFDAIELTAKGEILYPIEVTSHDLRAELRKQLFT